MGEVAALATAFDSEFAKSLSALPDLNVCPVHEHDAHLNHHRQAIRFSETISYYASKLPPFASAQRILTFGNRLVQRGEYKLAKDSCYEYVKSLNLHLNAAQRLDDETRLSYHVQAWYGVTSCQAALLHQKDTHIKQPDTLQDLVLCMKEFKDALALVLPAEGLYWLTLNGTVHIYQLAKKLLVAGFVRQILPFLVFCVKALESHVVFSSSKHLPWRTQLYVTLCNAYIDSEAYEAAKIVVKEGNAKIEAVIKLQKLDPVPVKPAVEAAFRTARAMLSALQLRLEVMSAPPPSEEPAKATPGKAAPGKAAKPPAKGVAVPEAAVPAITVPASIEQFQPLLEAVSLTPLARLTAILEALEVPSLRVLRHQPPPAMLMDFFKLVIVEAFPKVAAIGAALKKRKADLEAWEKSQQAPAPEAQAEGEEAVAEAAPSAAEKAEGEAAQETLVPSEPPALEDIPEAHELPLLLHKAMLCLAYNFEMGPQFEELLEVAQLRLEMGPGMPGTTVQASPARHYKADDPSMPGFSAATTILAGMHKLEKQPGPESVAEVSRMLSSCYPEAAIAIPDMLGDAALLLYMSARPLLDGVFCAKDKEAGLVTDVLRCLHACWEAIDFDDAVLRVSSSIKLALLLENRDELYEARNVLQTSRLIISRLRCDAALAQRHADDEHLRWISASRNQPSDSTAKLLEGMGDTEQELACLHTNVLAALYRLELSIGCLEQMNKATSKQGKMVEEIKSREKQSSIFGPRTMHDKQLDTKRIQEAARTTSNPPLKERELLSMVGKNPYERALLLMQMAPFQPEVHQQAVMMQEAAELLGKAQSAEDFQFVGAQPNLGQRTATPLQPKILQRTPTSVVLTHFPLLLKSTKKAVKYAVYAKSFGAGIALGLNKTACEYPGTGAMTPLDESVTVEGLHVNDTYVFAVAAYDDAGQLIGGLGTSTKEVIAALPLPLYMCWSHLVLLASKMGLWSLAKRGSGLLFPHFIETSADRPLWEANPMDAQRLNRPHLEVAAKPLLRTFVQAVYSYTDGVTEQEAAAEKGFAPSAITSVGKEFRTAYLEEQVARLKSTKRLLIAIKVSALLKDEMLIQEGSVRAYHLLGPLLALKCKSPLLHKCLSSMHVSLQGVHNLVQDSMVGQEHNRATAAQLGSTLVYHLVDMSTLAGELAAAAYFGKLELELLKAYDTRFDVPERTTLAALGEEAASSQEALLLQPQVNEYGSLVLTERMGAEKDIVARTLPLLSGPTPIDAWDKVLAFEDASQHPRWVELVVKSIEASARKGHLDTVKAIAEQVTWHVKQKLKRPEIALAPWSLQEAMDSLPGGRPPSAAPPEPGAGAPTPEDEEAEREALRVAEGAERERMVLAAVMLMQKRLPLMMLRRKAIEESRKKAKEWAPWLARLNAVLGLIEAAEGKEFQRAKAAAAQAQVLKIVQDAEEAGSPPPSPSGKKPGSPKSGAKKAPPSPKGAKKPGSPKRPVSPAKGGPPPVSDDSPFLPGHDAPVKALQHFARAAQLAYRGASWPELLNALRHLWNCSRALLNADASLARPTPELTWELGSIPPQPEPPASMISAAGAAPGGKGDKKAAKGAKEETKKKPFSSKGGKKNAAPAADAAGSEGPQIWLAKGSAPNTGRALRSAVEALLSMVADMRSGKAVMHNGVIPLGGKAPSCLGRGDSTIHRPRTAATEPFEPSEFSYGSDLQAELWFQNGSLDMLWCQNFIQMVLLVLTKMERWHSLLATGQHWNYLSEGAFNEKTLPYLVQAGSAAQADISALTASMDIVMRDKNQALDELDKVRTLVRERIGDPSMLQLGVTSDVKKKTRVKKPKRMGTQGSISLTDEAMTDTASMVSTVQTSTSYRSRATLPDFASLPAEYVKVIEILKKRCEKASMILAIQEMGDVHAHFGNWGVATTSWNDALDALIGPYQVLKYWRKALDPMSQPEILQSYSVHGLLLAAILLGKLSRYSYYDQMDIRLQAARMSATLLSSIFCSSVAHPQRRIGFATYVPRELWDSASIFSDPYRCNMTDLMSSLETTVTILLDHSLALDALPIIALWEHVTYLVTRNMHAAVLCRVKRVDALLQLGMMSEACSVLSVLMAGRKLPDPLLDTDLVVKNEDGTVLQVLHVPPFNNQRWPGDEANKEIVAHLSTSIIPSAVEKLYGPWLVAHINMSRSQALMCLGGLPNLWRLTDPETGLKLRAEAQPPQPVETELLDQAGKRLAYALAMAKGEPSPASEPPPGATTGKTAKKPGSPKKKEAPKPESPGGVSSPSANGENDLNTQAQRGEVYVRAQLQESQLEMSKWRPLKALACAEEALRFMATNAERLNSVMQDNDESERYAISQLLWMKARLQAARCTAALRHTAHCYKLVELALSEAAEASDALFSAELLQVKGNVQQMEGQAALAIGTWRDVIARYQALSIEDLRISSTLVDMSMLHDQLGLQRDSTRLGGAATMYLEAWTSQMGLREAKEHPELVNLYASGTSLYAVILKHTAKCCLWQKDIKGSRAKLEDGLLLLRKHCRPLPPHVASTALALGRVLRLQALSGASAESDAGAAAETTSSSMSTADLLSQAQSLLTQALTVASLDAGHLRPAMRASLLEMGTIYCASMGAPKAAFCLRSALVAAARSDILMQSSHTLSPVNIAEVPEWALAFVKGQEEQFNAASGLPGGTAFSDPDIGRALFCLFVALSREAELLPTALREGAEAQRVLLHTSLAKACVKYSTEACFPEVPVPPEAPTAPAAGSTLVQWYTQDVCWQEPSSWAPNDSVLPGSQGESAAAPSDSDILTLPPASSCASMLYVLAASPSAAEEGSGPNFLCGEVVFDVEAVRKQQRHTKELRYRIESPKAETDLFGEAAPDETELSRLRRTLERFLARRNQKNTSSRTYVDSEEDDEEDLQSLLDDGSSMHDGAGGMSAGAPRPVVTTDLQLLTRCEAMLSIENGVEVTDQTYSDWLAMILPKN